MVRDTLGRNIQDLRRLRIVATENGYAVFEHKRPGALGQFTRYYTLFRIATCERVPGEYSKIRLAVAAAAEGRL